MRITFTILAAATLISSAAFAQDTVAHRDYKALYNGSEQTQAVNAERGLSSPEARQAARGSAMAMRLDQSTMSRE